MSVQSNQFKDADEAVLELSCVYQIACVHEMVHQEEINTRYDIAKSQASANPASLDVAKSCEQGRRFSSVEISM